MKKILPFLAAAAILSGCSTDLDVNAPYKDVTVVYGLLDMRDSIQFIKINKAFLGEGNALAYAQVPDSNEYGNEDISYARVHRYLNGVLQQTFDLRDTLITTRAPGTFYAPDHTLYYFKVDNPVQNIGIPHPTYLYQNSIYVLDLMVRGQQIAAETNIVNDFPINPVNASPTTTVNFFGGQGYIPYVFKWDTRRNGKRYEASWRFNYTEIRGTDTLYKSVTQRMGTRVANNSAVGNELMELSYDGLQFYTTLAGLIPFDASVDKRIFTGLDLLVTAANDEFHTALSLSEPVSGIVEERPAYTNVENGFGIFASRYTQKVLAKRLNGSSLNELLNGQYTGDRRFCYTLDGQNIICD
jgi:hypothetical protein